MLVGAAFTGGYREQEMPGEVGPEVLPPPVMSNLGSLKPCPSKVLTRYVSLLAYATAGAGRYKPNHQE